MVHAPLRIDRLGPPWREPCQNSSGTSTSGFSLRFLTCCPAAEAVIWHLCKGGLLLPTGPPSLDLPESQAPSGFSTAVHPLDQTEQHLAQSVYISLSTSTSLPGATLETLIAIFSHRTPQNPYQFGVLLLLLLMLELPVGTPLHYGTRRSLESL